jgi:hypothetical protein
MVSFFYVAFVAISAHLLPHIFSWELNYKLVLFLMIYAALLQFIAWVYKKLPVKPKNRLFSWMERVSLF